MHYDHTQYGYWHWLLLASAGLALVFTPLAPQIEARVVLGSTAAATALAAGMFAWLRIRDEDGWLVLRYGPLPLFRKRFSLGEIRSAEPGRTSVLDGWGIHWGPGRGWTYNVWGFDCVKLAVGSKTVRIGTDDPEGLLQFLHAARGDSNSPERLPETL